MRIKRNGARHKNLFNCIARAIAADKKIYWTINFNHFVGGGKFKFLLVFHAEKCVFKRLREVETQEAWCVGVLEGCFLTVVACGPSSVTMATQHTAREPGEHKSPSRPDRGASCPEMADLNSTAD